MFSVLKTEAPTGCLQNLSACLPWRGFIYNSCHIKELCVSCRLFFGAECFGFWLQPVNFSESVAPGVHRQTFPAHQVLPSEPWGPAVNSVFSTGQISRLEILRGREGAGSTPVRCLPKPEKTLGRVCFRGRTLLPNLEH